MRTYARLSTRSMMGTVATERTITCPECGAPRVTRANVGVRIGCLECGHKHLVTAGAPAPQGDRPGPGPGLVVARARPVIPQTARPRPRAGEATEPAGDEPSRPSAPEDAPDPAPAPSPTRTGKTGDPKVLTASGRRGGLANYVRSRFDG